MKHKDKWLHAAVGAGVGLLGCIFPPVGVFALSGFIAVGKELYDLTGRGAPEMADIAATLAGTGVVLIALDLIGVAA